VDRYIFPLNPFSGASEHPLAFRCEREKMGNGLQNSIPGKQLKQLERTLRPLIGSQLDALSLPVEALSGFEPSQIGTLVGALFDACIPGLPQMPQVGLKKFRGILGDREGYPDYIHTSGKRVELKLLYIDNPDLPMKRPKTFREPSARLTQKVTTKNVQPENDVMLLLCYQLRLNEKQTPAVSPTIIDLTLFPVIDLIRARDQRMLDAGGKWFGNYETPTIPSKIGSDKLKRGLAIDRTTYARKESEGKDLNEDTNFGKLKRIPFKPLQMFLKKWGCDYCTRGTSVDPWTLD
jgi:hypothetical protein